MMPESNYPQQIILTDQPLNVLTPVNAPPLTPEEAAQGHHTVTMVFEHKVLFTISHGRKVLYPKGYVGEVPVPWSEHWFLLNSGARPYNRPIAPGAGPSKIVVPATRPARQGKSPRR